MIRLNHQFEFSASHRLYSAKLNDEENRKTFGKCSNPNGHGHNYELEVSLSGTPDSSGMLMPLPELERIVNEQVIEPFDHKHLNAEVPEFRDLNPSVENIAIVIFRRLKPRFENAGARLASVTVWETPKTWCEYFE
jgi:6-pyruvoyltetrahydropterin/6-carboxytetrahydropterin synthase